MTVRELYDLFKEFKENEFHALEKKVDLLLYAIIGALLGVVGNLITLILK